MGDFIWSAVKIVVIYYVFYWLAVGVFGGAACVGCWSTVEWGMPKLIEATDPGPNYDPIHPWKHMDGGPRKVK